MRGSRIAATLVVLIVPAVILAPARVESSPTQEPICGSREIPRGEWALMTPNQRRFQQLADTFTNGFITAVFGRGPYPPCLCQAVRSYYFSSDTSQVARELARRRRDDAEKILQVIAGNGP